MFIFQSFFGVRRWLNSHSRAEVRAESYLAGYRKRGNCGNRENGRFLIGWIFPSKQNWFCRISVGFMVLASKFHEESSRNTRLRGWERPGT